MTDITTPISESYWVQPGRFLAGEYPAAAYIERARERLVRMLDAGINTFIDLTIPNELPPYYPLLFVEAEKRGHNIQHLRFPILDHSIPPRATMIAALNAIDTALAEDRNVYIHCWGGIGRTGTTIGCYLVRHGMTGEQALAQLAVWWKDVPKSSYFPRSPETERQTKFVLNWKEDPDSELPPQDSRT